MTLHEAIGVKVDIDVKTGKKLSHSEIYGRAIEFLGWLDEVAQFVPFPMETLCKKIKSDPCLNNTAMNRWDAASGFVCEGAKCRFIGGGIWTLYRKYGINAASNSDGVCILKEAARRMVERKENCKMKVLYFEGAGWSGADISRATIGNCRIRTAFHLDNGRAVYLEIIGSERTRYSSPEVHKWQYTSFVDACFYITDEKPNDDQNKHRIRLTDRKRIFQYTETAILKVVNSLGASFDAVKVVPDLGGYRVFPEEHSCDGPDGYYYGDVFQFDPEMTARREAIYNKVYQIEKAEREADYAKQGNQFVHNPGRAASPNFSLWVDEKDPGLLRLLRHFNGYNKHWTIRTDTGNKLEDWMLSLIHI